MFLWWFLRHKIEILRKNAVVLAKFSALLFFFPLKTQNINKTTILCSSINKIMGKTLITTQQARGTTGGNWEFWVKSLKSLDNLNGSFGNAGF